VHNADGYKEYVAALPDILRKFGGRYVTRGGRTDVVEGKNRSRVVVLEFPSYDAAMACYRSPEYAKAISLRQASADADLIVIEGYDGPQP
jgi:uncharacterized protein (DUF1330 family)